MLRRFELSCIFFLLAVGCAVGADSATKSARLSAADIAARNVSARGGAEAWRAIQAMTMTGKMEVGGNDRPTLAMPGASKKAARLPAARPKEQVQLPFVMVLKRPRKSRIEIKFNGQTAVQVYDGANGWKLRPFLNRHQVEPYTAEEMKAAGLQSDLDGPLVDYAAKGTNVDLEGMEKVEGHDTYKLKLTLKNGAIQHLWVDVQSYLEVKIEGTPRRLDGKYHAVATYFRDYRPVDGVVVPYIFETAVEGVRQTEKIQLEKVAVNPKLEDSLFAKLQ